MQEAFLSAIILSRFRRSEMLSYGNGTLIGDVRLLRKITIKAMKECFSMGRHLSTRSCRKASMNVMPILEACLVLASILQSIRRKVTSTFMALAGELVAPCTRIDLVMFVIGECNFIQKFTSRYHGRLCNV